MNSRNWFHKNNQTKEKLGNESVATIILNSLPEAYKKVKSALKYGSDSISLDAIISAAKCKELELVTYVKVIGNSESLFVKSITSFKKSKLGKQSKPFKNKGNFKCFLCPKRDTSKEIA